MQIIRQIFITSLVSLGQICFGYTIGWTAPVIPILQDPEQSPLPVALTDEQSSWVGSLLYVGVIIGPYATSYLSNAKGRKICLFLGGTILAISYITMALAKTLAMIYAARILMGFGAGIIFIMNLIYIGEIASTNIRGTLLTTVTACGSIGTLLVYSVGPFVPYTITCWLGFVISAAFMVAVLFLSESPVFQMLKGEENNVRDTLKTLGRENDYETINTIVKSLTMTSSTKGWSEIFIYKSNRKAFFITLSLNLFQQASGIVAVIFFATTIFELAGSSIEPHIATIVIGVTLLFSTTITPIFVEKIGRRSLLLFSTALSSLSLAVLGLYFYLDRINHSSVVNIGWLPLLSLISFCVSYDIGLGVIPNTLIGEMFRANVRSTGSTISITVAWGAGFGIAIAFGYMVPAFGADVTFWIFSLSTAFSFIFTLIFVPETKGKTFIEIEEMLIK